MLLLLSDQMQDLIHKNLWALIFKGKKNKIDIKLYLETS